MKTPHNNSESNASQMNIKVSPGIFLAIVILSFVFFISGLLHLLVRILLNRNQRHPQSHQAVTALQGQLQHLFHLHDAGVNQSFIDALPIFHYKSITGIANTFDCAVCLCEFEPEDKLRSLPKCSHAFHMGCIDTWLLSHSTCPLCRSSLLTEFNTRDNLREIEANPSLSFQRNELDSDLESSVRISHKSTEIEDESEIPIKLGKFRKSDDVGGEEGVGKDARRCLSMGSFQYVVDEKSLLRVPIRDKQSNNKKGLIRGLRAAVSECDCDSIREFDGFETCKSSVEGEIKVSCSRSGRCESWRRGFSFRFPGQWGNAGSSSTTPQIVEDRRRAVSEIDFRRWIKEGEGDGDGFRMDCGTKAPSFAKRTLDWLMGREGKFLHDPF